MASLVATTCLSCFLHVTQHNYFDFFIYLKLYKLSKELQICKIKEMWFVIILCYAKKNVKSVFISNYRWLYWILNLFIDIYFNSQLCNSIPFMHSRPLIKFMYLTIFSKINYLYSTHGQSLFLVRIRMIRTY